MTRKVGWNPGARVKTLSQILTFSAVHNPKFLRHAVYEPQKGPWHKKGELSVATPTLLECPIPTSYTGDEKRSWWGGRTTVRVYPEWPPVKKYAGWHRLFLAGSKLQSHLKVRAKRCPLVIIIAFEILLAHENMKKHKITLMNWTVKQPKMVSIGSTINLQPHWVEKVYN